jgi:Fic family protein
MKWIWQQTDWPQFRYLPDALAPQEGQFLHNAGVVLGSTHHLLEPERLQLVVELISAEAIKTSEIEGEVLDRDSVQSSLRRQFGLQPDSLRVPAAERGIAEMLTDLYRGFATPLSDAVLFGWHRQLMSARSDLGEVGGYRSHPEPMQVVSGPIHAPRVHYEAPPSEAVATEMAAFHAWFNDTAPEGPMRLPALTRAGLAHLYFECIHPFEDGNGRIGRAIAEKALAQAAGRPTLTALSMTLQRHRVAYYDELERANKSLDVTRWLVWFADRVIEAQAHTLAWVEFIIAKAQLLRRLDGQINPRQHKVLLRLLREGPDGFRGGLSAGKYQAITGAPSATARRDLGELVALGALTRTGQLRGTRYWLAIGKETGKEVVGGTGIEPVTPAV